MQKLRIASLMIAVSGLAGCNQSDPAPTSAADPVRSEQLGIFLSSDECAFSGKLSIEQCGEAIQTALSGHDKEIAGYQSETDCLAMFPHSHCEVRIDGRYRRRAQAFLVTFATPPNATALFRPGRAIVGFRTASGQEVDATDKALQISRTAFDLAQENAASADGGSPDDPSDALARAAASIR
jgi:uncharacterized protein YgiB involved in biofilm formation